MLLIVCVYSIWIKTGLLIAVSLILTLLVIERSIHTEYRVSRDSLVVHRGRLSKDVVIPMSDIRSMVKTCRFKAGSRMFSPYIIVEYGNMKNIAVFPDNIDGFISLVQDIKEKRNGRC